MKQSFLFFLISGFSIFVGSQITEGILLVPYWQSLTSGDFYSYYQEFGPLINRFYTFLTIFAVMIPITIAIWCRRTKSDALKPALLSSLFALFFMSCFYLYFKEANQQFYEAALNEVQLKKELIRWSYWHWGRVLMECLSLLFLIIAINRIQNKKT